MFLRGSGPLISVLIPSRDRPNYLVAAIDSLWSLAHDKKAIEFIIKVDEDDEASIKVVNAIAKVPNVKVKILVTPQGNGYSDMHLWVNQMAAQAEGDWLFLFNDDAKMVTQNWDFVIGNSAVENPWFGCWEICLFQANTVGCDAKQFLLLRRKVFEELGHFSLSPQNDTYVNRVMEFSRMYAVSSLQIEHFTEQVQDKIKTDGLKAIQATNNTIHSVKAKKSMCDDVMILLRYLDSLRARTLWWDYPQRPGWWFWDCNEGGEGKFLIAEEIDGKIKSYELRHSKTKSDTAEFVEKEITQGKVCFIRPS